jgi:hypothetical protein
MVISFPHPAHPAIEPEQMYWVRKHIITINPRIAEQVDVTVHIPLGIDDLLSWVRILFQGVANGFQPVPEKTGICLTYIASQEIK